MPQSAAITGAFGGAEAAIGTQGAERGELGPKACTGRRLFFK